MGSYEEKTKENHEHQVSAPVFEKTIALSATYNLIKNIQAEHFVKILTLFDINSNITRSN